MSNRTLVELKHDFCPNYQNDEAMLNWAHAMASYMRGGEKRWLPPGVTFKHRRHHSEPDPMSGHGDPS